ncbi:YbaK/EbsC family protein [Streptomyces spectabilis]|uniref:YbaK/EbsC family protein n=1 Tax=Streptomyces spectabilis TaxID=68270 RepID=A0A516RAX7_STRST|nr:YbaK/EbsC family protein [Streptomyces spectabilis]QDQ12817.1 YbaK/EbsC family protein [Streptomyces spectabilis]
MESTPSSSPPAAALLVAAGVAFSVHQHVGIRTGEDIRIHTAFTEEDIENSLKTVAFTVGPERLVLAAVPGPARIRYGRLASVLGVPRSALKPADEAALQRLDMERGGVGPICDDPGVTVVFDATVPQMGSVLCGSGRSDCTVEAKATDIVRIPSSTMVADITSP